MPKSKSFVEETPARPETPGPKSNEMHLTKDGRERPSDVPLAPPLGYVKQPTIHERIRDMVRSEHLRREAEAAGAETFEEADDFDVGDDFDPSSPYEGDFDPLPPPNQAPEAPGGAARPHEPPEATTPTPGPDPAPEPSPGSPGSHTPGGGPEGGGSQGTPPPPAR